MREGASSLGHSCWNLPSSENGPHRWVTQVRQRARARARCQGSPCARHRTLPTANARVAAAVEENLGLAKSTPAAVRPSVEHEPTLTLVKVMGRDPYLSYFGIGIFRRSGQTPARRNAELAAQRW